MRTLRAGEAGGLPQCPGRRRGRAGARTWCVPLNPSRGCGPTRPPWPLSTLPNDRRPQRGPRRRSAGLASGAAFSHRRGAGAARHPSSPGFQGARAPGERGVHGGTQRLRVKARAGLGGGGGRGPGLGWGGGAGPPPPDTASAGIEGPAPGPAAGSRGAHWRRRGPGPRCAAGRPRRRRGRGGAGGGSARARAAVIAGERRCARVRLIAGGGAAGGAGSARVGRGRCRSQEPPGGRLAGRGRRRALLCSGPGPCALRCWGLPSPPEVCPRGLRPRSPRLPPGLRLRARLPPPPRRSPRVSPPDVSAPRHRLRPRRRHRRGLCPSPRSGPPCRAPSFAHPFGSSPVRVPLLGAPHRLPGASGLAGSACLCTTASLRASASPGFLRGRCLPESPISLRFVLSPSRLLPFSPSPPSPQCPRAPQDCVSVADARVGRRVLSPCAPPAVPPTSVSRTPLPCPVPRRAPERGPAPPAPRRLPRGPAQLVFLESGFCSQTNESGSKHIESEGPGGGPAGTALGEPRGRAGRARGPAGRAARGAPRGGRPPAVLPGARSRGHGPDTRWAPWGAGPRAARRHPARVTPSSLRRRTLRAWTIRTTRTWTSCAPCAGTRCRATTTGCSHARAAR